MKKNTQNVVFTSLLQKLIALMVFKTVMFIKKNLFCKLLYLVSFKKVFLIFMDFVIHETILKAFNLNKLSIVTFFLSVYFEDSIKVLT